MCCGNSASPTSCCPAPTSSRRGWTRKTTRSRLQKRFLSQVLVVGCFKGEQKDNYHFGAPPILTHAQWPLGSCFIRKSAHEFSSGGVCRGGSRSEVGYLSDFALHKWKSRCSGGACCHRERFVGVTLASRQEYRAAAKAPKLRIDAPLQARCRCPCPVHGHETSSGPLADLAISKSDVEADHMHS